MMNQLYHQMVKELKDNYDFDFEKTSYKKLEDTLSLQVRSTYEKFANQWNLNKDKPIYSPNGILIANGFDRIVIGDYGPYIEFTREQSNHNEFVVATGQEYRLTERYHISPFEVIQKKDNVKAIRKVIIAGGRDFNNYELLKKKCDYYLSTAIKNGDKIIIVSGTAKGADTLGERYAKERGFGIERHPANWEQYGKKAGYLRNAEMTDVADALIAFWDEKSRGTGHMINLAKERKLLIRIVNY